MHATPPSSNQYSGGASPATHSTLPRIKPPRCRITPNTGLLPRRGPHALPPPRPPAAWGPPPPHAHTAGRQRRGPHHTHRPQVRARCPWPLCGRAHPSWLSRKVPLLDAWPPPIACFRRSCPKPRNRRPQRQLGPRTFFFPATWWQLAFSKATGVSAPCPPTPTPSFPGNELSIRELQRARGRVSTWVTPAAPPGQKCESRCAARRSRGSWLLASRR